MISILIIVAIPFNENFNQLTGIVQKTLIIKQITQDPQGTFQGKGEEPQQDKEDTGIKLAKYKKYELFLRNLYVVDCGCKPRHFVSKITLEETLPSLMNYINDMQRFAELNLIDSGFINVVTQAHTACLFSQNGRAN